MVRFHEGRALMVRDRPPNVLKTCKRLWRSTSKLLPKSGLRKFLGAWHFLSLPPFRGFRPYPTSACYTSVNSKHFGFCLVKIGPLSWSIWGFERCKMWRLAVLWPRSSQLWSWTFHWLLPYTSCSLWCSLSYYDVLWAHPPMVFEIRGTKLFHLSINISGTVRVISETFSLSSSAKWPGINGFDILVYFGLHYFINN